MLCFRLLVCFGFIVFVLVCWLLFGCWCLRLWCFMLVCFRLWLFLICCTWLFMFMFSGCAVLLCGWWDCWLGLDFALIAWFGLVWCCFGFVVCWTVLFWITAVLLRCCFFFPLFVWGF